MTERKTPQKEKKDKIFHPGRISFITIIALSFAVGALSSALYFQNGSSYLAIPVNEAAKNFSSQVEKNVGNRDAENFNKFISFTATAKEIDGSQITLTDLPNFAQADGVACPEELTIVVTSETKISRTDLDGKKENAMQEIPARIGEIKKGDSLKIEFYEAIDLKSGMPAIEVKKIRIEPKEM